MYFFLRLSKYRPKGSQRSSFGSLGTCTISLVKLRFFATDAMPEPETQVERAFLLEVILTRDLPYNPVPCDPHWNITSTNRTRYLLETILIAQTV